MADPNKPASVEQVAEAIVDEEKKGFPVVWLLPLVALLVGGWLLYKTLSEKGPEVVITFQTAEGIEEGKTKLKYRDVTIGQVSKVRFSRDLSHVLVTAEMVPGTEHHLTESTQFWVVRPRVGAGEISGLGTLISGAYITMDPGVDGKSKRRFQGLEKPPAVTSDVEGTTYRLQASKLGSLSVGSPVYYRQIIVGEVTEYNLADNHKHVDVSIFIRAPHDQYVRTGTRFWNAGGVDISLDAGGVNLQMESLLALVSGGVAFETPAELVSTSLAPENKVFPLYDSYAKTSEVAITDGIPYVLNFTDTLRGLSAGAPVEIRGIRIGTVTRIEARLIEDADDVAIPVHIELEPQRTLKPEERDLSREELEVLVRQRVEKMVELGMRARLQTGNLLTGQLYIDLDIFPDEEPMKIAYQGDIPEIPTLPRPLSGITTSVTRLLNRLEKAPVEKTLENLNQVLVSTNNLVSALDKEAPGLARDTKATLQAAADTLASLEGVASKDGAIGNELYNTLAELRAASRSIRVMADYLERHPEALIKGKGGNR